MLPCGVLLSSRFRNQLMQHVLLQRAAGQLCVSGHAQGATGVVVQCSCVCVFWRGKQQVCTQTTHMCTQCEATYTAFVRVCMCQRWWQQLQQCGSQQTCLQQSVCQSVCAPVTPQLCRRCLMVCLRMLCYLAVLATRSCAYRVTLAGCGAIGARVLLHWQRLRATGK